MMRFRVTLSDGTVFDERECSWDEIPKYAKIERLAIVDDSGAERLCATAFARYIFGNEAVSVNGGKPVLEAKIIGGVRHGERYADCWRIDIAKETVRAYTQPVAEFAPHVFRQGAA